MWCSTVGCIVTLALSILVAPLCSDAQPPAKVPRIGYLSVGSPHSLSVEAFLQGLRELGWVENQNIGIEWRFARERAEFLPDLAAELVRLQVDVIVSDRGSQRSSRPNTRPARSPSSWRSVPPQ